MSDRPAIVITEFMDEPAVARLAQHHATHYAPDLSDRADELRTLLADARALIVRNRTQVTSSLLEQAGRLEVVGRLGVGLENIDLDACAARGIAVIPATGANATAVAEYVIAATMMLVRGAYRASAEVASGAWPRQGLIGGEIAGRRLGLVGFGQIARETAARALALGMTVSAYDPFIPADDPAWRDVTREALADLLGSADVVSLHVPATPETRGMLDEAAIRSMRPGAILINTARGGLVDAAALVQALKENRLGGAALDVFASEPLDAGDGAGFSDVPNLILTPHIAGVTREANTRVSSLIADKVLARLEQRA